ncbi:MAG TPA: VPLPA-CTERM-specific exosortase XrtD, partial [Gammaproteobacteria bacterium]|nr:VPLPA-CTERM-specific exosortase XrtD [Gammaproteobacteria bacterium]
MDTTQTPCDAWRNSRVIWLLLAVMGALLFVAFYHTIGDMLHRWDTKKEYGYAYMIPFITAFLLWQRKNEFEATEFRPSWVGVGVLVVALFLLMMGLLATTYTLPQYSLVLAVMAIAQAHMGWRGFRIAFAPLFLLFFMVPLPPFLYNNLSGHLQLWSSQLGVAVIRLFDISVYLSGNVIDLGTFKLQVAQACSGLRYLFPLVSLSFIAAYLYRVEFWKRAVIFLSAVPLTVLMNSFRIGMIGVLVNYWGIEQAEGFLHEFEGWVVFMGCIAILVLEMLLLNRVGSRRRPLREVFGLELPAPLSAERVCRRPFRAPLGAVVGLLGVGAVLSLVIHARDPVIPKRVSFAEFPVDIGAWKGDPQRLQQIYLKSLKLDDYIMADYSKPGLRAVNFYVAYYATQEAGDAAHSPRACIPGGGWEIASLSRPILRTVQFNGHPLRVNRVLIKKGDVSEVVYYWFQER